MLKWVGHDAVAVLDGGFPAWVAAGGPVAAGAEAARPDNAAPYPLNEQLVTAIDTASLAARVGTAGLTVVDARASARFRGEVEPLDPVAGHIPGALNRPFTDNLLPDGRFKSPEQLRSEFTALLAGRDAAGVVHQCGSGVSAVPNLIAMEMAGFGRAVLYPGSWSAWCNTSGTPRARG
jgi:thiosulfate/3-mercaptopyruvate sulfurtransferase